MWAEKYRPNHLNEIIGQEHIVKRLQYIVDEIHNSKSDASFPHMMFAGPAGVGKTSIAIALMKTMFGDVWQSNFLELNASDNRSISDIRTTVKDFSRRGVLGTYEKDGVSIQIPFNVVFLDECDNLTPDAQSALRRIMEKYSKQTRFILSCNYPHKIIDPIRDRCAFTDSRFKPIPKNEIFGAINVVCGHECLKVSTDAIEAIAVASEGSMRKALNLLFSVTRIPIQAEVEDVADMTNEMKPKVLRNLLALAIEANNLESSDEKWLRNYRKIDSVIEKMGQDGLSGVEILESFHRTIQSDLNVPVNLRKAIYKSIGEAIYWSSVSQNSLLSVKTFLRRVTI
tara:strand:+ start:17801 stop:18823 length:1023 start_codon:yes stop_codon:yes gene_type:complete